MKNFFLALSLGFVFLSGATQAQVIQSPWVPGKCAKSLFYDGKKIGRIFSQYNWIGPAWKEIEQMIAQIQGKPSIQISIEYVQYRSGVTVIGTTEYAPDCNKFPAEDPELVALFAKSDAGQLKETDLVGPRWIHTIQAIDVEEVNCLALSKKNNIVSGCADQWQDGLTPDKVVCHKGLNYLKCHTDCLSKIYNHQIDLQPGYCPEKAN